MSTCVHSGPTAPDRDAFVRDLYATYRPPLLSYLTRLTGNRCEAEDIVQETMIRAWRNADKLTPEHGSVWGWLARVARNIMVDRVRARCCRPAEVEEAADPGRLVGDHAAAVARSIDIERALALLSPPRRAVIRQAYWLDRRALDVAASLGMPLGTVKSRLHYAIADLRGELADWRERADG